MKQLFFGLIWLSALHAVAQFEDEHLANHSFRGEIIRSYSINPNNSLHILIGLKGDKPGSGKVYQTYDAGENWIACNNGLALCDSCEDVQAVEFYDDRTYLAGTWKNGLYISKDAGKTFKPIASFPAKDIRSIEKSNKGPLLAATTTHGIMTSVDADVWLPLHDSEFNRTLASWHIEKDPEGKDIFYAMTFGNGIYKTIDHGKNWKQVFHKEGVMIWDIAFYGMKVYAIGSDDSLSYLIHGYKGDKDWGFDVIQGVQGANSIEVNEYAYSYELLVGTWTSGVHSVYLPGDIIIWEGHDVLPADSIGSTKIWCDDSLMHHFTWGDGVRSYRKYEGCNLYVPNVMTPNCDGINCFEMMSTCKLDYFNFRMYNRWGEPILDKIASIEEVNRALEIQSQDLQSEVYVYWIKFSFADSEDTLDTKGHITVIK